MAFNEEVGRVEYTASAGQTLFPFAFKIFVDEDINIYKTASGVPADDANDILILANDYTITINGDLGGQVTLLSPSTANDRITIVRALSVTRPVDYQTNGDLLAGTLNADQDYQTYLISDQQERENSHLSLQEATQGVSTSLPAPEALKILGWNSTEDALENFSIGDDSVFINIYNIDKVSDLNSINPSLTPTVNIRGYNIVNDGGGGLFNYDPSISRSTSNIATIIDSTVPLSMPGTGIGSGCWIKQHEGVLTARHFGAFGDGVNDDSDALQAIEDIYQTDGGFYIEYPFGTYKITKQINYVSGLRRFSFATISGDGVFNNFFSPKDSTKWATTDTEFHNFVFLDKNSVTEDGGSTSIKRGIDFTSTSNCFAYNTKGVLLNKVVGADPAPTGVHQYTRRVHIHGLDGSDVNYLFDFEPVPDNNFAHGDIEITGVYNVGSTRWGGRCEDADGFSYIGSTMFPSGHLVCSGNYILIDSSKQFEPAALDYNVIAPNGIRIKSRNGGLQSTKVSILGVQVAKGGASGLYGATAASAAGVLLENIYGFNIEVVCNDCSTESVVMTNCVNGTFNIVSNNANSQAIVNPQAMNTYDALSMLSCTNVRGKISAGGVTHKQIAFLDDSCIGCSVDASGEFGGVRIPFNSKNSYSWNLDGAMTSSNNEGISTILYSGGEVTPTMHGWNGSIIVLANSVTTNITDISGGASFNTIKVIIQDGVTKLLDVPNGGNFVFKTASFQSAGGMTGILTASTFIKNSVNGNWVEA